ncbi:hypothetical protein MTO96_012004 [Rhipicephalus appendiculatus]
MFLVADGEFAQGKVGLLIFSFSAAERAHPTPRLVVESVLRPVYLQARQRARARATRPRETGSGQDAEGRGEAGCLDTGAQKEKKR